MILRGSLFFLFLHAQASRQKKFCRATHKRKPKMCSTLQEVCSS